MFWNGMRLLKLGDILRAQKHFFKELVSNKVTVYLIILFLVLLLTTKPGYIRLQSSLAVSFQIRK
jgi:hypothetical protein